MCIRDSCQVQSNSPMIREAFSDGTTSKTVVDLSPVNLSASSTEKPNTALGLQWNLVTDTLCVKTESKFRPMTRRGLLSYIMSPYDPFGIAAPAMLSSKLFQREIIPPQDNDPHHFNRLGWDDPLPDHVSNQWQTMVRTCEPVSYTHLTLPTKA